MASDDRCFTYDEQRVPGVNVSRQAGQTLPLIPLVPSPEPSREATPFVLSLSAPLRLV